MHAIHQFPIVLNAEAADGTMWKNGPDDYGDKFLASSTWHQIRQRRDNLQWSKLVWFSQGVPHYAFITWLAFRDRLATGHRTSRWGQPQCCMFCGEPDETREHLYFACPYTYTLWLQVVGNLFGVEPDPDWDITVSTLLTRKYDRITFILL